MNVHGALLVDKPEGMTLSCGYSSAEAGVRVY